MNVAFSWWLLIVVNKIIFFVDANWITGNLCWSMPCMNGGSCFGSAYTYLCVCPINYSGALCEKRLGICQESPCGNRGLCVETGLTSFECRCYFDYVGPLCEEHVPKDDPSVWSSLIPVHTRVLFDILQEAYRSKAQGRSVTGSNSGQVDFAGSVTTDSVLSTTTLSSTLESIFITHQSETTEVEHVIPAEGIQLENIFPEISTASTTNMYTQDSTTQTVVSQNDSYNETTFSTDFETTMTSSTSEDNTTILLPSTTVENITTVSFEQNQTSSLNITEDQEFMNVTEQSITIITSTPTESSSYDSNNDTIVYTTEILQNSTEEMSNTTESQEVIMNNTSQTIDNTLFETTTDLFNQTDDNQHNSSELIITSADHSSTTDQLIDTDNTSSIAHSQLLYKLCQQLLSHILPNTSSSSSAVKAVLSLASNSSSTGNSSANALLAWIKDQFIPSTTTSTTTPSSPLPSLLINGRKLSSIPLQRIDIDDALYQMNNNIDGEH